MVSRTGRNKNGYGKISYNIYRFPYWKHLNTGTGSRTGKTGTGRYWERIWFPVLKEIKYGDGFPYYSHCLFIFAEVWPVRTIVTYTDKHTQHRNGQAPDYRRILQICLKPNTVFFLTNMWAIKIIVVLQLLSCSFFALFSNELSKHRWNWWKLV